MGTPLEGRTSWGRPLGGAYFVGCEYTLSKGRCSDRGSSALGTDGTRVFRMHYLANS
jgi:hypothetical protein